MIVETPHPDGSMTLSNSYNAGQFVTLDPGYTAYDLEMARLAFSKLPPRTVTPLQMRKALRAAGMHPAVQDYLANVATEEEAEAWEYAVEVKRDDPMIAGACVYLGWDEAVKDQLFALAATFNA